MSTQLLHSHMGHQNSSRMLTCLCATRAVRVWQPAALGLSNVPAGTIICGLSAVASRKLGFHCGSAFLFCVWCSPYRSECSMACVVVYPASVSAILRVFVGVVRLVCGLPQQLQGLLQSCGMGPLLEALTSSFVDSYVACVLCRCATPNTAS